VVRVSKERMTMPLDCRRWLKGLTNEDDERVGFFVEEQERKGKSSLYWIGFKSDDGRMLIRFRLNVQRMISFVIMSGVAYECGGKRCMD
jgi:hypothetical protein